METVLLVVAVVLLILLLILVFSLASGTREKLAQQQTSVASLQQQLEAIRTSSDGTRNVLQDSLQKGHATLTQSLQSTSETLNKLHNQIGQVITASSQMQKVGDEVKRLQDILSSPKLRGGLGEWALDNLLSQILPQGSYQLQYGFKDGQKVDALVKLADYAVPIDSKFPLENFRKIIEADDDSQKEFHKKQFYGDVKKHIDAIAQKYILPSEGTSDFAFMYIPAENVYYEIISHDFGNKNLFDYAKEKGVIPVSPNIFNAYLGTIVMGLSGMKIAENAKAIFKNIKNLELYFGKIRSDFLSLGTHIKNAHSKYELTDRRMEKFQVELEKTKDKELEVVSEKIKLPEVKQDAN